MKYGLFFVAALTLAGNIAAQEPPDYSRETLIKIFANNPIKEPVEPRVQFGFGYIDFRALNMRWRFAYAPMMPLYGSIPWQMNGAMGSIPDPFVLTNTPIASPPRTWRQSRDMNAELKRIERTEKSKPKATVVAKPE